MPKKGGRDLGELLSGANVIPIENTRVIHEAQAARAMQICDLAGIPITKKVIWNDREQIANGLADVQLRNWPTQKR